MNEKTITLDIDKIEEETNTSVTNKKGLIKKLKKKMGVAVPEEQIEIKENTIEIKITDTYQKDHLHNESLGQIDAAKAEEKAWKETANQLSEKEKDPIIKVIQFYSGETSTQFSSPVNDEKTAIESHKEEFNKEPTHIDNELFILIRESGTKEIRGDVKNPDFLKKLSINPKDLVKK